MPWPTSSMSDLAKRLARARITGTDPGAERDAAARLKQLLLSQIEYTGRAPMGTGDTGALSAGSYSEMLNEQKETLDLQNLLGGKGPLGVEAAYGASSFPEPSTVRGLRSRNVDVENQAAMAQAEGARPQEDDILYNWEQIARRSALEAETEKANAAAATARRETREAANPELAAAHRAASVADFGARRNIRRDPFTPDIMRPVPSHEPSVVRGITPVRAPVAGMAPSFTAGGSTELAREAMMAGDPNFAKVIAARAAMGMTDPKVLQAQAEGQAKFMSDIIKSESDREVQGMRGATDLAKEFAGTTRRPGIIGRLQEMYGGTLENDPLLREALRRQGIDPDTLGIIPGNAGAADPLGIR